MLELKNVSKKFKSHEVLNNVNYKFEEGNIYGIQGRNSSGKTVLLKCICGLAKISSGEIKYNEKILNKDFSILPSIGVIIETPIFWKDKTGMETLAFLASIKGDIGKEEIDQVLNRVGLSDVKHKKIKKYSLGMRQRLAIAQAIMEKPKVLLLDEPTNSLDSEGVKIFQSLMLEEKSRGAIILIVSHVMDDISNICDETLILADGDIKYIDTKLGEIKYV